MNQVMHAANDLPQIPQGFGTQGYMLLQPIAAVTFIIKFVQHFLYDSPVKNIRVRNAYDLEDLHRNEWVQNVKNKGKENAFYQ